jgi:hypothetical protein
VDTGVWVALIASATSLVVSAASIWNQRVTARAEQRSQAKRVLDKYRGPLLAAAFDLGHRINNIRHDKFLNYLKSTDRAEDARRTTLFRCAQYFGWREILRTEVQLLRFDTDVETQVVAALIADVDRAFATDALTDRSQGMLWAEEQRGIGELMVLAREDGSSICRGYAAFAHDYQATFEPWMDRLASQVLSSAALSSYRLRLVQWALAGLVTQLDDKHAHTDAWWMTVADSELLNPQFDPISNPKILPKEAQQSPTIKRPGIEERIRADLAHARPSRVPKVPPEP